MLTGADLHLEPDESSPYHSFTNHFSGRTIKEFVHTHACQVLSGSASFQAQDRQVRPRNCVTVDTHVCAWARGTALALLLELWPLPYSRDGEGARCCDVTVNAVFSCPCTQSPLLTNPTKFRRRHERPILFQILCFCVYFKHDVSEIGFCLRFQADDG